MKKRPNKSISYETGDVFLLYAKRVKLIGYSKKNNFEEWKFCIDGAYWLLSFNINNPLRCSFVNYNSFGADKHLNREIPRRVMDACAHLEDSARKTVPRIGDGTMCFRIISQEDIERHNKLVLRLWRDE